MFKKLIRLLPCLLLFLSMAIHAEERMWNLKDVDLRTLISEVSKVTGKNFIIGPNVNAKVTFISNHSLSEDELYQAFLALLRAYGYAAIPDGQVINIVPLSSSASVSRPSLLKNIDTDEKGQMAVTVIRINNYPAGDLVKVLKPLLPKYSYIEAYRPSNDLIISDHV